MSSCSLRARARACARAAAIRDEATDESERHGSAYEKLRHRRTHLIHYVQHNRTAQVMNFITLLIVDGLARESIPSVVGGILQLIVLCTSSGFRKNT